MIERSEIDDLYTVIDVLDKFAVMKSIKVDGIAVRQTVPKDVQDLEEKIGLYIYTEPKVLRKRGGKSKNRVPVL